MRRLMPKPGGQLAPDEVVGRDALIQRLWQVLNHQSVVITAERRMGKTSVILKMKAAPPEGIFAVYQDLEQVHTADELADLVYREVRPRLGTMKRVRDGVRWVAEQVKGANVTEAGVSVDISALPWNVRLSETIAELDRLQQSGRFIFFWDELPLMVDQIAKREGERQAMEVLDLLRALRHQHQRVRMVYTGSIGLHHVLTRLQTKGYSNDPTNDMHSQDLPPLSLEHAVALALDLLAGAEVNTTHNTSIAEEMARVTDGIAFYIHRLASDLGSAHGHGQVDAAAVRACVTNLLTDANDPVHFHHFETRVASYYPKPDRPAVMALLDALAVTERPLRLSEVFNLLKAKVRTDDVERARELLGLLCRDHYLQTDTNGAYHFRFSIIRRWWCLHRGLEAAS